MTQVPFTNLPPIAAAASWIYDDPDPTDLGEDMGYIHLPNQYQVDAGWWDGRYVIRVFAGGVWDNQKIEPIYTSDHREAVKIMEQLAWRFHEAPPEPPIISCADLAEQEIWLSPEESARLEALRAAGKMRPTFRPGDHGIPLEE